MRAWGCGVPGSPSCGTTPDPTCLSSPEVDDFCWEPPSEAETKVLQARRERQDRISRLMGDYLLRGYRMLGETCAECGVSRGTWGCRGAGPPGSEPRRLTPVCPQTILLQDKQRKVYCVACQELDSDVDKDNPGEGPAGVGRGVRVCVRGRAGPAPAAAWALSRAHC